MAYRISSMVRDAVQSRLLGASLFSDVFSLAFKFANLLRKLFTEGAFNASFLPIFSNILSENDKKTASRYASQVLTWLLIIVGIILIGCFYNFESIMRAYAPGIDPESAKFAHLVKLGKISSPYILISFIIALFGGVLNTVNSYTLPASIHLILNFTLIIGLFCGAYFLDNAELVYTLGYVMVATGILQIAILWRSVKKQGFDIGINFAFPNQQVKLFFSKLLSGALGAGVWQINVLLDISVLTFLPTGAISYFYYTDHINQVPISILGIAFSTALLPPLTKAIHASDYKNAQKQMNLGLLFAFAFTLPAMVVLILMNQEIIWMIYGGGKFSKENVIAAAPALAAFATGLPAYMAMKVFSTVFFAQKNTKIPLYSGIIGIICNLLFILILMPTYKHTGIALATSLSTWCSSIFLIIMMKKKSSMLIDKKTIMMLFKQIQACIVMAISIKGIQIFFNKMDSIYATILCLIAGILAFIILGSWLKIFEFFKEISEEVDLKSK